MVSLQKYLQDLRLGKKVIKRNTLFIKHSLIDTVFDLKVYLPVYEFFAHLHPDSRI